MKKFAIIVAGGTGSRMHSQLPKQFIELAGRPILFHTIEAFNKFSPELTIILVMNKDFTQHWEELCRENSFQLKHILVEGGKTRFESVKNGLNAIQGQEGVVAIHDAVRPMINQIFIKRCYEVAKNKGTAIPYLDSTESLREIFNDISKPIDRDKIKIIQTPQCFKVKIIKEAYNQKNSSSFTDDASVVDALGKAKINLIEGLKENIKITRPSDLNYAEFLIKSR